VAEAERDPLVTAGHRVVECIRHNGGIKDDRLGSKATLSLRTVWACDSNREIKVLLQSTRPDLAQTAV
jgi:hypothetical protein